MASSGQVKRQDIPGGFAVLASGGQFIGVNGPLYFRDEEDRVQLGFRVESRHTNALGICHGGMIATFCDRLLPLAARRQALQIAGSFLPTISIHVDYLRPIRLGTWVEGEAEGLRVTRTMVFAQGLVKADGQTVARVSGILKIGPQIENPNTHQ